MKAPKAILEKLTVALGTQTRIIITTTTTQLTENQEQPTRPVRRVVKQTTPYRKATLEPTHRIDCCPS